MEKRISVLERQLANLIVRLEDGLDKFNSFSGEVHSLKEEIKRERIHLNKNILSEVEDIIENSPDHLLRKEMILLKKQIKKEAEDLRKKIEREYEEKIEEIRNRIIKEYTELKRKIKIGEEENRSLRERLETLEEETEKQKKMFPASGMRMRRGGLRL